MKLMQCLEKYGNANLGTKVFRMNEGRIMGDALLSAADLNSDKWGPAMNRQQALKLLLSGEWVYVRDKNGEIVFTIRSDFVCSGARSSIRFDDITDDLFRV